jgi:hypothetical protein
MATDPQRLERMRLAKLRKVEGIRRKLVDALRQRFDEPLPPPAPRR